MRKVAAVLLATALAVPAGCGAADESQTLTVLAASSLTGTFTDLATQFEGKHRGVEVKLVFESSATLAQLAVEQAPGDVLATADHRTMQEAEAHGGTSGDATRFATNVLVLAVPSDNPARIQSLDDLDRDGVDYLTCVTTAPCGAAADLLLGRAGISREPASAEVDVKAVLGKVESGEADAGLVYRTDTASSKDAVTALDVPGAADHPNTYWVATTANARDHALAWEWIDLLTGDDGRAVLTAAGFGTG
jgi:molybdate transport system substrate-binding protein